MYFSFASKRSLKKSLSVSCILARSLLEVDADPNASANNLGARLKETGRSWEMRRGMTHRETRPERIKCYRNDITTRMAETQVLFRIERELLEALDKVLSLEGFRTRNEWFRAQIRKALGEASRKRLAGVLDRLSVEGIREEDIAEMVREWRSKKGRR